MVGLEQALGVVGEGDLAGAVLVDEVAQEQPGQQHDVVTALTQGRHVDLHRREAVVQVLTELAVLDGLHHVLVGGGHDADVGLAHGAVAHAQVFAVLEHAQQACLGAHGHLGHLIQEDDAAVGLLKVALVVGDGTGERALDVTEQFAVDGALGDGTAVHGDVFLVFAGAALVDDLGERLLT